MKELAVEANIKYLDQVQDFVRDALQGCPPRVQNQMAIAVDELFSNIAHYAYVQDAGNVIVRVKAGDAVTIEFEDSGRPYDPLSNDDPDLSLDVDAREVGGLGIFMVKSMMDSVAYRREGNKNILTIQKSV